MILVGADPAEDEEREGAGQESDEDEVQGAREPRARQVGQPLDREQDERRHERQPEGEDDDVGALRAAHDEELGIAPEQVEDRPREREEGERGQVQPAEEEGAPPVTA